MPVYEYSALDRGGKSVSGILDADSAVAARQKLRADGFFPVRIQESQARSRQEAAGSLLAGLVRQVKSEEVNVVTRQLATLLNAGIPLVGALDVLIRQARNRALKRVISQVKEAVNEGQSLSDALARYPRHFSRIYTNMVRAGEASGSLDVVLERLAEFGEHQQAVRSRFKAALVYPLFMALVGCGVLFFLLASVVPKITGIFAEMQQVLPLPTRLLIGVSDFLGQFWWAVLVLLLAGAFGLQRLVRTRAGRRRWDRLKLRLPVLGPINLKIILARYARTMASLLESGVPMLAGLQIVRNIVNNVLLAEVIDEAATDIREGRSMSACLAESPWFPPMFVQMVAVGEQSGDLEGMLKKTAEAYERETEASIMGMTALIEPVMILVMGVMVLFIVLSILLPIFEMNQMIR